MAREVLLVFQAAESIGVLEFPAGFNVDLDRVKASTKTVSRLAKRFMTCPVGRVVTRDGGPKGGIATIAGLAAIPPGDGQAAEIRDQ